MSLWASRVTEEDERMGLDLSQHNESGYTELSAGVVLAAEAVHANRCVYSKTGNKAVCRMNYKIQFLFK